MKKAILIFTVVFFSISAKAQTIYLDAESANSAYVWVGSEITISMDVYSPVWGLAALAGFGYEDGALELVSQQEGLKQLTTTAPGGYNYSFWAYLYNDGHARLTATW